MFHVAEKPSRDSVWGNQKTKRTVKVTIVAFRPGLQAARRSRR